MPLYEFRCAAGHSQERLAPRGTAATRCECGGEARRAEVYRIHQAGPPARRIDLQRALDADAEVKDAYGRAGMEPPDLIREAQARVHAMREAGVGP